MTSGEALAAAGAATAWRPDISEGELPEARKGSHGGKRATAAVNWAPAVVALDGPWLALQTSWKALLREFEGATARDKNRTKAASARDTVLLRQAVAVSHALGLPLEHPSMPGKNLSHARGWLRLVSGNITGAAQQHVAAFELSKQTGAAGQSLRERDKVCDLGKAGACLAYALGYKPAAGTNALVQAVLGAGLMAASPDTGSPALAAAPAPSPPTACMCTGSAVAAHSGSTDDRSALASMASVMHAAKLANIWAASTAVQFLRQHKARLESEVEDFSCLKFCKQLVGVEAERFVRALQFAGVVPNGTVTDEQWGMLKEAICHISLSASAKD